MNEKHIRLLLFGAIIGFLLMGAYYLSAWLTIHSGYKIEGAVTLYKPSNCGCCVEYIAYLRKNGYMVDVVETKETSGVRQEFGIPSGMESCHTAIFGDYAVEGHVPLNFIEKLLDEKPVVDGITLPGMPAGSPGMPGPKREPFRVFSFKSGESQLFAEE